MAFAPGHPWSYFIILYILFFLFYFFFLFVVVIVVLVRTRRVEKTERPADRRPTSRVCVVIKWHILARARSLSGKVKRSKRVRGAIMRGAVLTHKTMRAARNVSLLWPKTFSTIRLYTLVLFHLIRHFPASHHDGDCRNE